MQYSLGSLFHFCYLAAALSLTLSGIQTGRMEKVIPPLFMAGMFYTMIVAYRLRHTIARFAWDVTIFSVCWIFLISYATAAMSYLHVLSTKGLAPRFVVVDVINKGLSFGLAPLAAWAVYCLVQIYRRAKLEPEDDYC